MDSAGRLLIWLQSIMPGHDEVAQKIILTLIAAVMTSLASWLGWKIYKLVQRALKTIMGNCDAEARLARARILQPLSQAA